MSDSHAILAAAWIVWAGINYANSMQLISRGYESQVSMAKWHVAMGVLATLAGIFL